MTSLRRNDHGETELVDSASLITSLQTSYGAELIIAPRVCVVDARQASGPDMKLLRTVLADMKQFVCQVINRFLNQSVNQSTRKKRSLARSRSLSVAYKAAKARLAITGFHCHCQYRGVRRRRLPGLKHPARNTEHFRGLLLSCVESTNLLQSITSLQCRLIIFCAKKSV